MRDGSDYHFVHMGHVDGETKASEEIKILRPRELFLGFGS